MNTSIGLVVRPTSVGLGSPLLAWHGFVDEEPQAIEVKPSNAAKGQLL
jgi:hypothetical protein